MMNQNFLLMRNREEQLNNLLQERGAEFLLHFTVQKKNNTELAGYQLVDELSDCSPVIYYGDWYNASDYSVTSFLMDMYKKSRLSINASEFFTKDYILENIRPRLISKSNHGLVEEKNYAYRLFLDMFVLFDIKVVLKEVDDVGALILTKDMLRSVGITEEEAYEKAVQNLDKNIHIHSMTQVIEELTEGTSVDEELLNSPCNMLVCTNEINTQGASVMLCPSFIERVGKIIGAKVAILPSSIHECIVVPYESKNDFDMFCLMVNEINQTEVEPVEVLTGSVYYVENGEIRIGAFYDAESNKIQSVA